MWGTTVPLSSVRTNDNDSPCPIQEDEVGEVPFYFSVGFLEQL